MVDTDVEKLQKSIPKTQNPTLAKKQLLKTIETILDQLFLNVDQNEAKTILNTKLKEYEHFHIYHEKIITPEPDAQILLI
jgi:hypothetical protein